MKLISKAKHKGARQPLGELTRKESEALKAYWAGTTDRAVIEAATAAIGRAKRMGAWLVCDCRTSGDGEGPILMPRENVPGVFTLSRSHNMFHSDACAFHGGKGVATSPSRSAGLMNEPAKGTWAPVGDADVVNAMRVRMRQLIGMSGLDRVMSVRNRPADRLNSLLAAAASIEVEQPNGEAVRLPMVMWTNPRALAEGWVDERFKTLAHRHEGHDQVMTGYLFMQVDVVHKDGVKAGRFRFDVDVTPLLDDQSLENTRSLAMILCEARVAGGRVNVVLRHAVTVPSLSGKMFPVHAGFHIRACAERLYRVVSKHGKYANDCGVIELGSMLDADAASPEFMLRMGNRELAVKVIEDDANKSQWDDLKKMGVCIYRPNDETGISGCISDWVRKGTKKRAGDEGSNRNGTGQDRHRKAA